MISTLQLPDAFPVPLIVRFCENAAYATDATATRTSAAATILFLIQNGSFYV